MYTHGRSTRIVPPRIYMTSKIVELKLSNNNKDPTEIYFQ